MNPLLQDVLTRFSNPKKAGEGYSVRCPAHDDKRASLSISAGYKGIVLHCHAGCSFSDVAASLGIPEKDLFYETTEKKFDRFLLAEYPYRDEEGQLLYTVERYFPKDFRPRQPDGTRSMEGVRRVLYRLPELLAADLNAPVFFVEGERDADNLIQRGLVATTMSGGANSKWQPEFNHHLEGRTVVILPDNDEAGRKYANTIHANLPSSRILDLPNLPLKGDVSDWLTKHSTTDLLALLAPSDDVFIYAHEHTEPPAQRWVIDGWVPENFVTTLYAHGGSSKSFLAQYIAMRIVMGQPVFGHEVIRGPVLFLDGELDRDSWLRRAFMLARGMEMSSLPVGLVYRRVSKSLLDPSTQKDVAAFIKQERPALTVIDSFSACLPGNDTNSLDDVTQRIRTLSTMGTVLMIDHAAKSSDMTGSATAIGSVAKMMFARSALQIASSESGGSVLQHKKSNFGPLCEPVAYALNIGGGVAYVDQISYSDDRLDGVQKALPVSKRIVSLFTSGEVVSATSQELADLLDVTAQTIRNKAGKLRNQGVLVLEHKTWKLAPDRGHLPVATQPRLQGLEVS